MTDSPVLGIEVQSYIHQNLWEYGDPYASVLRQGFLLQCWNRNHEAKIFRPQSGIRIGNEEDSAPYLCIREPKICECANAKECDCDRKK